MGLREMGGSSGAVAGAHGSERRGWGGPTIDLKIERKKKSG